GPARGRHGRARPRVRRGDRRTGADRPLPGTRGPATGGRTRRRPAPAPADGGRARRGDPRDPPRRGGRRRPRLAGATAARPVHGGIRPRAARPAAAVTRTGDRPPWTRAARAVRGAARVGGVGRVL